MIVFPLLHNEENAILTTETIAQKRKVSSIFCQTDPKVIKVWIFR